MNANQYLASIGLGPVNNVCPCGRTIASTRRYCDRCAMAQGRLDRARRNYRRALTRHENLQAQGKRDLSPKLTRKMALAVAALSRAGFELGEAKRIADRARK